MKQGDAQRWLAAIVESSDDAVIGKRLDGTIMSWNAAATRIYGYTAAEMLGQSVLKLFPPELADEERTIVAKLVRGERIEHFETRRLTKDGRIIDVSLSVAPILDSTGAIIGASKIARDITREKQMREALQSLNAELETQAIELEERLQESTHLSLALEESNAQLNKALAAARLAQQQAEEASKARTVFLATMSHELRTPLNAIGGYADLMLSGVPQELSIEERDYVERIRRSQQHLLEMISSLLDFAKMDAGKLEVEVQDVPIEDVLTRIEPLVRAQARSKNQKLRIEIPAESMVVRANMDRAVQVLLNLVSNAIRFTASDGTISVEVKKQPDVVAIRVQDNGPGIPDEHVERVFEPFVQLDRSLTRKNGGTGLGLAISRDLARAMGGDVVFERAADRENGATFVLTLRRTAG
ncbi:MAG TPA: PAS domain-containing sensor histidine kinase [Gemmatimonadaceae bacterium]|nr:PAS domain-containing sensor histidine kinase [Gemmatimonadaceae bacterium]